MNKRNLLLSAFMSLGFVGAFAQVQKTNVVDEVIWVVGDEHESAPNCMANILTIHIA